MQQKIGQNFDSKTYVLPKNSIITETMLDLKFSAHRHPHIWLSFLVNKALRI